MSSSPAWAQHPSKTPPQDKIPVRGVGEPWVNPSKGTTKWRRNTNPGPLPVQGAVSGAQTSISLPDSIGLAVTKVRGQGGWDRLANP